MSGLASTLLHEARIRAGLSRRTLADRAGVAVSTVSRIEGGQVDPTVEMLQRVLAAAGSRLEARAVADDGRIPTIAELTSAIDRDGTGRERINWTRLRGFVDLALQHPGRIDLMLGAPPARTGTVLDQILAGLAEQLADENKRERPKWTRNIGAVSRPWTQLGTPRMIEAAKRHTPEPFARRNMTLARSALFHG